MKRITLTVVAVLLAVPAVAWGKTGIEMSQDPSAYQPGEKIRINIMYMNEPRDPMGGEPTPVVGVRPLATFRSESGRVVRVRGDATDRDGLARAEVTLPDRGPWTVTTTVAGKVVGEEGQQTFALGEQVPTVVSRPTTDPAPAKPGDGFPWVWVLSAASILAALLVAGMRRLGHWGAA
jgi:hypothetical protein